MPSKLTFIFQTQTEAADASLARPHSGGWTESIWRLGTSTTIQTINQLAEFRARLLPAQTSIVGYRQQVFTLDGNSLIAGGASTGNLNQPGRSNYQCDLPQVALQCSLRSDGNPNSGRLVLRGIPDSQMVTGEYAPNAQFKASVTEYLAILAATQCQFLGRSLAAPNVRVLSITNGVITTDVATGAAQGNFIRLLRVRETFGNPVTGTYRVSAPPVGFAYTVAGLSNDIVVLNSGRARLDLLALFPITSGSTGRSRVKKIGRPFESFRGRASKRRAG